MSHLQKHFSSGVCPGHGNGYLFPTSVISMLLGENSHKTTTGNYKVKKHTLIDAF